MYWGSWVKSQLRAYLCRGLLRDELLQELKDLDEDVQISTMRLSDMPRSPSLPSSTVEIQAERREKIRDKINGDIARLDKSCEHMAKALMSLGDVERTLIAHSYFSVDYGDSELAADMSINVIQMQRIRETALGTLYDSLCAQQTRQSRRIFRAPKKNLGIHSGMLQNVAPGN